VHRWVLTTTLLLTIIKLLKVGALLSWGRFSPGEPGPDLDSPSPDENPRGRGSYFPNQLWRSVGAEIICDRVQALNTIRKSKSDKLAVAMIGGGAIAGRGEGAGLAGASLAHFTVPTRQPLQLF
jgi:hypothetical protein